MKGYSQRRLIAIGLALALSACDASRSIPDIVDPGSLPRVATVEVTSSAQLSVGTTAELRAIAKDAAGNFVETANISWSSSSADIATVSSAGVVTGHRTGPVTIRATIGRTTGSLALDVNQRSTIDRIDDSSGQQVHVIYVLPSDGIDRELDNSGALARSVASFQNWLGAQTGKWFRFDTYRSQLDVTFFRLNRTNAEIDAFGAHAVTEIERELTAALRIRDDKLYLVYYDGGSSYSCGGAAWPPVIPGRVAAMYLQGTPPGWPACSSMAMASSAADYPGYWEFAALHDLIHASGTVDPAAPHHAVQFPAHVPEPNDLMYGGSAAWRVGSLVVDVDGDDYFGSAVPAGIANLGASPYLVTAPSTTRALLRAWQSEPAQVHPVVPPVHPGLHLLIDRAR